MLTIHRAERSDVLVRALADVLAHPGGDPFTPDIVAVPSRGVERWLAQQLSHRLGAVDGDGVCANVQFPNYRQLLDDTVAAADERYAASVDAWSAERSVWPLLTVIDSCVDDPGFRVLARHLGQEHDRGRRFAVANKLARYFATYGASRPELITSWSAGRDEQGDGTPLPDDLAWQAELWRRLRAHLGVASPAELLADVCRDLVAPDLPAQFSVFGPTRMPPARIAVLAALARKHDVHVWLHHPSPALWESVRASGAAPGRRRDAHIAVRNQLLASMSRDVREFQTLLMAYAPAADDAHHPVGSPAGTVLGRLQHSLATDTVPAERVPVDDSVVVHACHGRARQVEVVREAILRMLADDPTLEPRDIVIMCPDVEAFAPLVAASFGMADEPGAHPAAQLRVRLADRSLQQTNPLLTLLSQLLELARSRVTATGVLDIAGSPPVRRAFGFDDDDVERLREWTAAAGARWGFDAAYREPYGLAAIEQGTWRTALDRVLLGVAMEEGTYAVGDTLPLDDVDSGAIELAGRFAELVERLDDAIRAMTREHTIREWTGLLRDSVLGLGEGAEAWQAMQLRRELNEVAESAQGSDVGLGLADIATLLRQRLAGRPTRASFRTGTLTVCTLVPMRSVPHRVVCLLGMDDGTFPRQSIVDGDDVLAREPRTGERDFRSEDRQLFLDAIWAAQERLVLTYNGADPRNGVDVPPCVPLGELLDALDVTATGPGGARARDSVVVRHPLQPFDPRNFEPGELGGHEPFSFDPVALAGARAGSGARVRPQAVVSRPLPRLDPADLALDELVRFFQHPGRAFLRQRLDVSTTSRDEDPDDDLPVELEGLDKWAIGDRSLKAALAGVDPAVIVRLEQLRGTLPPGPLGRTVMREIGGSVSALLAACRDELVDPAHAVDIRVPLLDDRTLSGTVPGVRGLTLLTVGYSRLGAKHRLTAWLNYLALVAGTGSGSGTDGDTYRAVTIGRYRDGSRRSTLQGIGAETARMLLTWLAQLRDTGLCAPLPMALETSALYGERRTRGASVGDATPSARAKWEADRFASENAEPEHVLLYGDRVPFARLLEEPANDEERSWAADETTRFGALATTLWQPLCAHETDSR